jgi:integrase
VVLTTGASDRALWATAFYAGLRRGELAGLRWEDVDLDASLLHVRRGWDYQEGPIEPKSQAGVRSVPLCRTLRAQLLEHRLRSGRSEGLVFGRTSTRPFEPGGVQARADTAWKRHGLERVTLHECRHAYSTFLDAAEVWPTRADRYMGHSDHSTPGRYRHQLEQQYAEDAARLDRYLTGAQTGAQATEPASLRGI